MSKGLLTATVLAVIGGILVLAKPDALAGRPLSNWEMCKTRGSCGTNCTGLSEQDCPGESDACTDCIGSGNCPSYEYESVSSRWLCVGPAGEKTCNEGAGPSRQCALKYNCTQSPTTPDFKCDPKDNKACDEEEGKNCIFCNGSVSNPQVWKSYNDDTCT